MFSICTAVYAALAALIAIQARQRANVFLAVCCGFTAAWAVCGVFQTQPPLNGVAGLLDLIRLLAWYLYLLYLYKRSDVGSQWQIYSFGGVAAAVFLAGVTVFLVSDGALSYKLSSLPISIRLLICICELLLIENLYLNLPESARWHISLQCVLLGGLACFDILVIADTALFRRPSMALASGRTIALIIVAPLLVLTALRGSRWSEPVRLSRSAVFHSATLVLSGSVLLALTVIGEILRHLDETWGKVAELSLGFAGLISITLFLSSHSGRSLIDRIVVHHFFAHRYDYRMQWLSCIDTLSGKRSIERTDLYTRAVRAIADVVDSPKGALFLRENITNAMVWASSWNMPAGTRLLWSHPVVQQMVADQGVVDLRHVEENALHISSLDELGPVWLAVPLLHSNCIIGVVVVGPPRIAFRLDREVFDLLDILGQEVGTYMAEQQAAEVVSQTRNLHEYAKRFAFVAHDIKNVSSQLTLLLSNAEHHLENPAFQRDMLGTVQSSVSKIDGLLKRLDEPSLNSASASINPTERLNLLVDFYRRVRTSAIIFKHDISAAKIAMSPDGFDTAITHILNNAIEAAPEKSVLVKVEHEAERITIDITDQGNGMTAEFVRNELFSPFKTRKLGGSGIGAFQARELISEAGGEILVISKQGCGTTVRVLFKLTNKIIVATPGQLRINATGD